MKAILGDCNDIPENLAEPTLTSTARVTLSLDHLHCSTDTACVPLTAFWPEGATALGLCF
jgi:hypothetical protein